MKICVIIPAYNEALSIGKIIAEIRKQNLNVLVVDDGSTDNTSKVVSSGGAVLLVNNTNHGKGSCLIKGFGYALENGFDAVITMDGDGQHLARDIPSFLKAAENSNNSIFVGNRMLSTKNMPAERIITNKFMSCLISIITKQRLPDTQCGFRLIKRELLQKMKLTTRNYEIESEIILRASSLGAKIESVPISTVYEGNKSMINPFMDAFRFIRFILEEIFKKH